MKKVFYYETKIGKIAIVENKEKITNIYTYDKISSQDIDVIETPLIKEAAKQLEEYFCGKRKSFDFPIDPKGTDFQKKVWRELQNTPYGETLSYKDIAERIGNPKAARAIGMANNKNPILIIIPCHRIIGKNGKLVGYAAGLDMKVQLLEMENKNK